jgi:YidC/Oxa1 family membrane protein insertase
VIGAAWYDPILNGLGAVLAFLYDLVPSYGVAIILLTLGIRLLLLPLGIKQIRSMHAMQALQPKVKALQQKYKGNRAKFAEEQMKLYRESGASPLGGCLPMLLQIPVLIALFAVLRFPNGLERIPVGSELRAAIESQHTEFVGANLLCAPRDAGQQVQLTGDNQLDRPLDCGGGFPVHVPYYLLLAAMIGTTFYQTWQMQRATPVKNPQQQLMMRIMPLVIGFVGWGFPAGLILYWTTTNLVQIGQQHFMLPKRPDGADAADSAPGDGGRKVGKEGKPAPRTERASGQMSAAERAARRRARRAGGGKDGEGAGSNPRGGAGEPRGSGERHGRSRKKRRKR